MFFYVLETYNDEMVVSTTVVLILDCQDWRGERRRIRNWSLSCCRRSTRNFRSDFENQSRNSSTAGSSFLRCRRRSTWSRRSDSSNRTQKSSSRTSCLCWPDQHSDASRLRQKLRTRHQQGRLLDLLVVAASLRVGHRSRNQQSRTGKLSAG